MSAKSKAEYMRVAIDLSIKSAKVGESPYGAVIVKDGRIISRGQDRVKRKVDPTAHAEIIAIRQAATRLQTTNLAGCKIYLFSEPCPMCACAIKQANISEVYYACTKEDMEQFGVFEKYEHPALVKLKLTEELELKNTNREEAIDALAKIKDVE